MFHSMLMEYNYTGFGDQMEENARFRSKIQTCFLKHMIGSGNNSLLTQGPLHSKTDNETCVALLCATAEKLEWYCYILIVVGFTCLVFGFLGNTIVLLNYAYLKRSWTSSTIFVFNLALCDFMWIIIVPVSLYLNLKKPVFHFAPAFCHFKRLLFNINIYGSIFFLTLISFDRYLCSVHPLTSLKWWNKKKAKMCTITIWLFIFLESIPDLYYMLKAKRVGNIAACIDRTGGPMSYAIRVFRIVFGFIIPGTVIFTCYLSSLRALKQLKEQNPTWKKIHKPLMLISVTMIVFVISFAPYHVMMALLLAPRFNYSADSDTIFAIYQLSEIICSISSCADPLIFILASYKFQRQIKAMKCSFTALCMCYSNRVGVIAHH